MYIREVNEEMQRKHGLSLEANNLMITLMDKYLLQGEVPDNLLCHLSLYFLTKAHKTLLAIRMLVVSGFEEDANVLLRTLVEILITLGYISKKPEERVNRFIEYEFIEKHRLMKSMNKHYPETVIDQERKTKITEDYRENKHKYNRQISWSDKSVADMAEEIGVTYWYEIIYKPNSSFVHSNVSATKGFMLEQNDELLLAVGPQSFAATDILSQSCELARGITYVALSNMSYSTAEVMQTWGKAQQLLEEEYKQNT